MIFEYIPHPHIEKRKKDGPPKNADSAAKVHGKGRAAKFNNWFAIKITNAVGSMWCAYLFGLFDLISLPAAIKGGKATLVSWVAQTFLQLVLLSIIIVGQNIQAAASDARAQATYDDAAAVLEEAKQIQAHLLEQDKQFEEIMTQLKTSVQASSPPAKPLPGPRTPRKGRLI
jgi:hypothetical protein